MTHGQLYTGEYVLGHHDPQTKNILQSRALDCIDLRPSTIIYGKHEVFLVSTNKTITKKYCSPAVMTPEILNQINKTANKDKMRNGINIKSDTNNDTPFAGVKDLAVTNNKYEYIEDNYNEDNLDYNVIEELLHESSTFYISHESNQLQSTEMNETIVPTATNKQESFNDTEEEIIFDYNNEELFENSNKLMEYIFDLQIKSDDDRVETNKDNINDDNRPNEVLELNAVNKENKGFNHEYKEFVDQEQDIRELQPNRKYKDYY